MFDRMSTACGPLILSAIGRVLSRHMGANEPRAQFAAQSVPERRAMGSAPRRTRVGKHERDRRGRAGAHLGGRQVRNHELHGTNRTPGHGARRVGQGAQELRERPVRVSARDPRGRRGQRLGDGCARPRSRRWYRHQRQGTAGHEVQPGRQAPADTGQGGCDGHRYRDVQPAGRRRRRPERRYLRGRRPRQRADREVLEGRQVHQGDGARRERALASSTCPTRSSSTPVDVCSSATAATAASRSSIRRDSCLPSGGSSAGRAASSST